MLILGVGVAAAVAFTAAGLWAFTKGEGQTQVLWQNVPASEQSCITRILQQRGIDTQLLGAIHAISPDDPLILPFRQQCQNQTVITPEAQPKWDISPNGPR